MNKERQQKNKKNDLVYLKNALKNFGGTSEQVFLYIVIITILISTLSDSVFDIIKNSTSYFVPFFKFFYMKGDPSLDLQTLLPDFKEMGRAFITLVVMIPVTYFIIRSLKNKIENVYDDEMPYVGEYKSDPVRVLIVTLSKPQDRWSELSGRYLYDTSWQGNTDWFFRTLQKELGEQDRPLEYFDFSEAPILGKKPERMAMEAIIHQLNMRPRKLEKIILVSTRSEKIDGTFQIAERFKKGLESVLDNSIKVETFQETLELDKPHIWEKGTSANELDKVLKLYGASWKKGVSPNKLDEIVRLYNALWTKLITQSQREDTSPLRDRDILVDATGGQAINSIAAAAFACLSKDRSFQYVDTNSYEVKTYDFYYNPDALDNI